MFCIKVPIGKERAMVRQYSSAFLPTYTPAAKDSTASKIPGRIKKLIIPGYVFTLTKTRDSQSVNNWEWKLIEALSSSSLSTVNNRGQVLSGPLKGMDEYIASVDLRNSVATIKARLLGEYRTYHVAVALALEEEKATLAFEEQKAEQDKPVVELEKSTVEEETGKMAKTTYTEEQIKDAVALVDKIGNRAAAKELNISWQLLAQWTKKAKAAAPSATEAKKAAPSSKAKKTAKKATEEPAPAQEPAEGKTPEKANTKAAERAASALEIENATLRERVAQLTAQNEKLKKALAELL